MRLFRVSFDTCEYQEKICIVVADSDEEAIELVKSDNPSYFNPSDRENRYRRIESLELSLEEKGVLDTFYF